MGRHETRDTRHETRDTRYETRDTRRASSSRLGLPGRPLPPSLRSGTPAVGLIFATRAPRPPPPALAPLGHPGGGPHLRDSGSQAAPSRPRSARAPRRRAPSSRLGLPGRPLPALAPLGHPGGGPHLRDSGSQAAPLPPLAPLGHPGGGPHLRDSGPQAALAPSLGHPPPLRGGGENEEQGMRTAGCSGVARWSAIRSRRWLRHPRPVQRRPRRRGLLQPV